MKIQIEEKQYEGSAAEIVQTLQEQHFDHMAVADTESYLLRLRINFMRMTGRACPLPTGDLQARCTAMLQHLAGIGALVVLEEG